MNRPNRAMNSYYDARNNNEVYAHPEISHVLEFTKNKLYFATLMHDNRIPKNTENIHFFSIDDELQYNNFYNDFGPLNLACLYRYCYSVNRNLRDPKNRNKFIVHYTSHDQYKRANAAYLIGSFAVLYLRKVPDEVYSLLTSEDSPPLKAFQDASMGPPIYTINILDCLNGLQMAASFGFFNFEDFDINEYERYSKLRNGDINWIVPQKFLAFMGPSTENGTFYHPPEHYINYFIKNSVVAVVRLNKKTYDATRFIRAGFAHYNMFMPDGSLPSRKILHQFLQLAENTDGAIAIHCKAGLGRTGTLIGAYMMKHYTMSARETIAWLRICRPGSVIGHQQAWLESMEKVLWKTGQQYRLKFYKNEDIILQHKQGIYSILYKMGKKTYPLLNNKKIPRLEIMNIRENYASGEDDKFARNCDEKKKRKQIFEKDEDTQGDLLNKIKVERERMGFSSSCKSNILSRKN